MSYFFKTKNAQGLLEYALILSVVGVMVYALASYVDMDKIRGIAVYGYWSLRNPQKIVLPTMTD